MIDKAIAKITEEAMAINDPVAFAIEEHLTELCTNSTIAGKLLAGDKSLKAAHRLIWDEAKKRKKGDCAYIPPEEVFSIVDKYFGLDAIDSKPRRAEHTDRVNVLDMI